MGDAGEKKVSGGLPPGEPCRLETLLDYAPGAVVSRTLVKGKAGTITLFAFDQGQELSEHTTPFDALVQVVDGRVRLVIGGREVEAVAGETVLMPADVPHAVQAVERVKFLLIMIRG
jgi:quercetin dioxygenase-like cupin family protein